MTREEALALLKKYNKEPFHLQHAFTVEGVMRWYANELGHGDEADFWALVGLLHDVDFEQWPEQHCKKAPELLAEIGADDAFVHAVCSHGYGLCSDVEPVLEMEKVLFAADELTGLVGAAALMRPSKSVQDMELKSLKKKYKSSGFAAGCSGLAVSGRSGVITLSAAGASSAAGAASNAEAPEVSSAAPFSPSASMLNWSSRSSAAPSALLSTATVRVTYLL